MGIDRRVYIINGWAVIGMEQVKQMETELENIDEYYMDDVQGCFVSDCMCGEYIYFGGIIDSFNPDYEDAHCFAITEKDIFDADEKYKNFLEKYPKYAEVFKKYTNNERPQVMVALHVW